MDKKKTLQSIFWALVAVVLVWLCFRSIDWEQFWAALKQCRWLWVVVAMLAGVANFWLHGVRWWMLLEPIDPSIRKVSVFNAYNIGNASNFAIPHACEVVRLGYVMKHSGLDGEGKRILSADKVLGTMVVERLWDFICVTLIVATLVIVRWNDFGTYLMNNLSVSGSDVNLMGVFGVLILLVVVLLWLAWYFRERFAFCGKVWEFAQGIFKGLASCLHMEKAWLFFFYTLLIWVLYWLTSLSILWAVQDIEVFSSLTVMDGLLLTMAGTLSSVIPVPGGFGAYHGVVGGVLLGLWDIPMSMGMIYATLNHESHALVIALLGLWSYLQESFFDRKK